MTLRSRLAGTRLGAKLVGAALAGVPAGAAGATSLDLSVPAWPAPGTDLVAVLYDGPVTASGSTPEALKLREVGPAESASEAGEAPSSEATTRTDNPRLTLRFTDLAPGRYGIALYPNDRLGRFDLSGLGVPKRAGASAAARRRPRFDHAIVRVTDGQLSLQIELSY